MRRKGEITKFITDYLKQYNVDSYEAYAEKEDIARACESAIQWADETMIDKVCQWINNNFIVSSFDSTKIVTNFSNMYDLIDSLKQTVKK